MTKYLVLGSGPVGLALTDELKKTEDQILLVNKSGQCRENLSEKVQLLACDARDQNSLAQLCQGVQVIFFAAGVSVANEAIDLPLLVQSALFAAQESGAVLVYLDTMWAYGNQEGRPISEASPEQALGSSGKLRVSLSSLLRSEIGKKKVKIIIARSPDIYGPRVLGFPLGEAVFGNAVSAKPLAFAGRLDMPHSFIFVRDLARSLVVLANNEDAIGKTWHLPSPQTVTQGQIRDMISDSCNRQLKVQTYGAKRGLFSKTDPLLAERMFGFENPFVVNHSRFATTFGERVTAHNLAVFETLEWYKRKAGIPLRYGF